MLNPLDRWLFGHWLPQAASGAARPPVHLLGASVGAWMVSSFSMPLLYIVAGTAIGLSVLLVAVIPSTLTAKQSRMEKSYESN